MGVFSGSSIVAAAMTGMLVVPVAADEADVSDVQDSLSPTAITCQNMADRLAGSVQAVQNILQNHGVGADQDLSGLPKDLIDAELHYQQQTRGALSKIFRQSALEGEPVEQCDPNALPQTNPEILPANIRREWSM